MPSLSVVTPFYDTAEHLDECIRSVRAQCHGDFEYLLCDNASTDGSGEIAARHAAEDPRIRYVRDTEHLPQVENFNRALARIAPDSRWCKVVLADDLLLPGCLSAMVAAGESVAGAGCVASYYVQGTTIRGDGWDPARAAYEGREVVRGILLHDRFPVGSPSNVLYRADLVRARAPRFYEPARFSEDTDVVITLAAEHRIAFVAQVLSVLRVSPDSISQREAAMGSHLLLRVALLERWGARFLDADEQVAELRAAWRAYLDHLGRVALRGAPPAFWRFHFGALAGIGAPSPRLGIAAGALRVALRALGNPWNTLARVAGRGRDAR